MKNFFLFFFLTTGAWAGFSGGGTSIYGPGNPVPYSTLPVMSNGASCIGYWSADSFTGLSNAASIASGTLWIDLSPAANAITLNSVNTAINYDSPALGVHSEIRFPGNPTGQGIFSTSVTVVQNSCSAFIIARDIFQTQSVGSSPPKIIDLGQSNTLNFGEGVSQNLGQLWLFNSNAPSAANYFNQLFFPSDFCLTGFSNASTVSTCYMDNQMQVQNGIFSSTPSTITGGYLCSHNSAGQWCGPGIVAILLYSGPVTQNPSGVGYDALKQWASNYYGVNTTPRSTQISICSDSVFRGFGTNSNGAGNGLSPANWMQSLLPKNYIVYNQGWDGAKTSDLIANFSAYNQLLVGNKTSNNIFDLQIGNNDLNSGITSTTIEANINSICAMALASGWNSVDVNTIVPGGYGGVTLTNYTAVNSWITSTLPTLLPVNIIPLGTNAAVTNNLFSAPHLTNPGLLNAGIQEAASIVSFPYLSLPISVAGSAGYFLWTDTQQSNQSKTFMYTLNGYTGNAPVTITLPIPFSITPSAGELVSGVATSCSTTQFIVPIVVSPASGTGTFNSNQ